MSDVEGFSGAIALAIRALGRCVLEIKLLEMPSGFEPFADGFWAFEGLPSFSKLEESTERSTASGGLISAELDAWAEEATLKPAEIVIDASSTGEKRMFLNLLIVSTHQT